MVQYKLHYFNARGLAEPIRYILAYGNADWSDERIPFTAPPAAVPDEIKSKSTFGQVPLLEFEGQTIAQSVAIARFLAKKFNLNGADDVEAAKVDEVADGIRDFMLAFQKVFQEQDEEKKKELLETAKTTAATKFLPAFNSLVEKNGGHVVGKGLTWADFMLAYVPSQFDKLFQLDLLADFPVLKTHREMVNGLPGIKEHIAQRPDTMF